MEVKGIVVSVEIDVQVAKNGGGSYPGARLAYRDEQGAMKEKAFHNNVFKFNAPLKTQLSNLNVGQGFTMEMQKEGEFWNVKSIMPSNNNIEATSSASNKAVPTASPKSTYETSEERAKKQVYIVRQSSITAALKFAEINKIKTDSVESLIPYAKAFESYVFGAEFDENEVM